MPILLKGFFQDGKPKYYQGSDFEKNNIRLAIQFAKDHEGKDFYKEFYTLDELDCNKNLPLYYHRILLPPIFEKLKDTYNLTSIKECDALLCLWFGKEKKKKSDDKEFELILRIEEMSFIRQSEFITQVANIGITKLGLKFPNANEINKEKERV